MNNILVTSAGRRVSLVRFFKAEALRLLPGSKVFAADARPELSAACMAADGYFAMRRVTEPAYIEELLQLCLANGIRLVIPTIDTELLVLAQQCEMFAHHGISIVISDYAKVMVFRDKRKTHRFFEELGINCAKEFSKQAYTLPLYLKPVDGSRSVDNFIIYEETQLTDYHFANEKLMFLEYLDHKQFTEYTIDLYYGRDHELKCLIPRRRIEVRDGEVNKAVTNRHEFVPVLWEKMRHAQGLCGCITFQVFVHDETHELYGIEINPRFGGGFPLSYLAGGNFPGWLIQEYLLGASVPVFDAWEENLMMLRYDDEILVKNYTG